MPDEVVRPLDTLECTDAEQLEARVHDPLGGQADEQAAVHELLGHVEHVALGHEVGELDGDAAAVGGRGAMGDVELRKIGGQEVR